MSNQSDSPACTCGNGAGAAQGCRVHAHFSTEMGAVQRTEASQRAETAYLDWSTQSPAARPLRAHRTAIATLLFETLKAHDVTKTRFAAMLGVDKKQVRKMLDGRVPVPVDVAFAMPLDMGLDFLARIRAARGVRSDVMGEIDRLDKRALREVRDRVHARLDQIAEGK